MKILFFCTRWGSEAIPWEQWLPMVRAAGYDGVEWGIANNTPEQELSRVFSLAETAGLPIIAQHYETNHSSIETHITHYRKWWEKIRHFQTTKVNTQTGKDYFSFDENKLLIELATSYGKEVVHETHRGKFAFAAHITKQYLENIPTLRLALDASHWVNVAESLLDDQEAAMSLAIERTDHIHARVGYPEGPQVSDPRAPEWKQAFEKHLNWWDRVVERKRSLQQDLTITPEFGPFPYMVHDPQSSAPLADQWEINLFMLNFLKNRYNSL